MAERIQITESQGLQKEWMEEARKMNLKKLPAFLKKLTEDYSHDYGTICHAIAAAAIAAAWSVERTPQGGITGFQAGAIMWEMIKGWGIFGEGPKAMLCYNDLLYPQYDYKWRTISKETFDYLKKKAADNLKGHSENTSPNVLDRWKSVAAGNIPCGYSIGKES